MCPCFSKFCIGPYGHPYWDRCNSCAVLPGRECNEGAELTPSGGDCNPRERTLRRNENFLDFRGMS